MPLLAIPSIKRDNPPLRGFMTVTATVLTEDQTELLKELEALNLFDAKGYPEHWKCYHQFIQELEDLGIETVESWEDRFQGCFPGDSDQAGAKFIEKLVDECYPMDLSDCSFIEIDWYKTWCNLSFDYDAVEMKGFYGTESFIFRNC